MDEEQRALPLELGLTEENLQRLWARSGSIGGVAGGVALRCSIGEEGWATPMKEQMAQRTGYAEAAWWHAAGTDDVARSLTWRRRRSCANGGGGEDLLLPE
jgi:hypothetical protein